MSFAWGGWGREVRIEIGQQFILALQALQRTLPHRFALADVLTEIEDVDPYGDSDSYFVLEALGVSGDTGREVRG